MILFDSIFFRIMLAALTWSEMKKRIVNTLFLLFFAFVSTWSSLKFFLRAKQKFKIIFFCDHNVMSSF